MSSVPFTLKSRNTGGAYIKEVSFQSLLEELKLRIRNAALATKPFTEQEGRLLRDFYYYMLGTVNMNLLSHWLYTFLRHESPSSQHDKMVLFWQGMETREDKKNMLKIIIQNLPSSILYETGVSMKDTNNPDKMLLDVFLENVPIPYLSQAMLTRIKQSSSVQQQRKQSRRFWKTKGGHDLSLEDQELLLRFLLQRPDITTIANVLKTMIQETSQARLKQTKESILFNILLDSPTLCRQIKKRRENHDQDLIDLIDLIGSSPRKKTRSTNITNQQKQQKQQGGGASPTIRSTSRRST
jgi:hypothetical protein